MLAAAGVYHIRVRATRGHFSHLVRCKYTGMRVFILFFLIIFLFNKYVCLNYDVSISVRLAHVRYTQVTVG